MREEKKSITEIKKQISAILPEVESACRRDHVALIDQDSVVLIGEELKKVPCKRLLEIGSGYGYSALSFLQFMLAAETKDVSVCTIERLQSRWETAKYYIKMAGAEAYIQCLLGEAPGAFSYLDQSQKWDCVFMDAAMGRYSDFWLQLKDSLSPNGIFIADNINLHGVLDKMPEELPRRHRTMQKRLLAFLEMLEQDSAWQYERYDYGEGLLVIRRQQAVKLDENK